MATKIISPELGIELRRLYAELPEAHRRAAVAFRTDSPAHILEGDALTRFMAAEDRVAAIVRRIKEIQGA